LGNSSSASKDAARKMLSGNASKRIIATDYHKQAVIG
jgi:hypothetical protein